MPDKATVKRARLDARLGKAPSESAARMRGSAKG